MGSVGDPLFASAKTTREESEKSANIVLAEKLTGSPRSSGSSNPRHLRVYNLPRDDVANCAASRRHASCEECDCSGSRQPKLTAHRTCTTMAFGSVGERVVIFWVFNE